MIASFGKDYVIDALKKADAKTATVKEKDLVKLLERTDPKQSVSIAMTGAAAAKSSELTTVVPKEVLENLDAVGGGITISEDVQFQLGVTAKNAEAAKAFNDKITDNLNDALLALAALTRV